MTGPHGPASAPPFPYRPLVPSLLVALALGLLLPVGSTGAAGPPASTADTALAARDTLVRTIAVRQQTQQQREQWQRERSDLQRRFLELQRRRDELAREESRQRAAVATLQERIADLARRRRESDRLRDSLADTLAVLFDALQRQVADDLPFLPQERQDRLAAVGALLADPTASAAERLRRLLEALQIEAAYGRGVEPGETGIDLDGRHLRVQLLRLGRVALLWLTPDGARCGCYDPASGQWRELPGRLRRPIARALAMAAHTRPLELIELPLGRVGS